MPLLLTLRTKTTLLLRYSWTLPRPKAVLLQVLLLLYRAGYNSFLLLLLIRLSGYCSVCTLAALSSLLCNSVQLSHCSISTHRLLVACIRSTFAFSFGERGWFQIT